MVGMMAFSLLIFVGGEWGWSGEAAVSDILVNIIEDLETEVRHVSPCALSLLLALLSEVDEEEPPTHLTAIFSGGQHTINVHVSPAHHHTEHVSTPLLCVAHRWKTL